MSALLMHFTIERTLLAKLCREKGDGGLIEMPELSGEEAAQRVMLMGDGKSRFLTQLCDNKGLDGECLGHEDTGDAD